MLLWHHTRRLTVIGGVVVDFYVGLTVRRSLLEVAFYHITLAGGLFHIHRATVVTLLTRGYTLNSRLVKASSHAVEVK